MRKIDVELEMRALDAEMEGMKAENQWRAQNGDSIVYGEDAFFQLAEEYRKLKFADSESAVIDNPILNCRHEPITR